MKNKKSIHCPQHNAAWANLERRSPMQMSSHAEELLNDLQIHQIELKMQFEQLLNSQLELEKSRDRYQELYDSVPVGYLTLNSSGLIDEINLAGALLLGVERNKMDSLRFASFIEVEYQDIWHRHFLSVLESDARHCCGTLRRLN